MSKILAASRSLFKSAIDFEGDPMNTQAQRFTDVIYDAQFKQKMSIAYFPFTWQGMTLLFFCWLFPLNLMEAGGIFFFVGFIVYRMFIVRKDHEIENVTGLSVVVSFLKWVEKNKGNDHVTA